LENWHPTLHNGCYQAAIPKADAMMSVCSFLSKFSSIISCVLSCFDRVIFKGHLPISRIDQFERFVDYVLKVRRTDFVKIIGPQWSDRLVEHAKRFAEKSRRPYEYFQGDIDKDAWAKEQLNIAPVVQGLVGILCVMEACRTFKIAGGKDRPRFVSRKVPQRVLYYYFVDKDLGLIHVRLQTWAPFTCQVYANGHEYVARQLKKKGIAFTQVDNAFVALADAAAAQGCANRFAKLPWPKILERLARQVNPLLQEELKGLSHFWVIDQNQPGEFKVLRECRHRDGTTTLDSLAMCKGVGNMHHYQSQALACNRRYLEALSAVDDPTPGYDEMKRLTERTRQKGRSYAGFNPARKEEARLFAAVLAGDHIARGFRNQDIRVALDSGSVKDSRRHRQSAAVGRLLKRLHVRGLVDKVPRTRRWRVTDRGRRLLGDTLATYRRYQTQAA